MPEATDAPAADQIEQCADDLDECIDTLEHYSETVLATAMRLHLGALLRTMIEERLLTREAARRFLIALEQEALGGDIHEA
ncbi:MAG TPA: hypothetical protein VGL28_05865 [Steroidobacteraceae bacterium]|jgi:hypothetical protein